TGESIARSAVATELGRRYAASGLPEVAILRHVAAAPAEIAACQEPPGFDRKSLGTAFGQLRKQGLVTVSEGRVAPADGSGAAELEDAERTLRVLAARAGEGVPWEELPESFRTRYQPRKRGAGDSLVEIRQTTTRTYRITPGGRAAASATGAVDAPAELTREMLKTGSWRQ